jgi:PKD domain-containing protein
MITQKSATKIANLKKFVRSSSLVASVILAMVTSGPAQAHVPGIVLSGLGTATIDGILNSEEWAAAGHVDFLVNIGEGTTTPATFFAMNDADNLYLALRVESAGVAASFSSLGVEFDNDHDGVREEGDDAFVLNPPDQVVDSFRTYLPPCPIGAFCGLLDSSVGGTNDGLGRVLTAEGFTVYETSRPLNNADDAHDFSLQPGDTIGWELSLRLFVNTMIVDTLFPTSCFSCATLFADIRIQPAPILLPPTIEAGGPYFVNEGNAVMLTASASDPDGGAVTVTWDLDGDGSFETPGASATFSAAGLDGPFKRLVTARAVDNEGQIGTDTAQVGIQNLAPAIGPINAPTQPVPINTRMTVSANFTDAGRSDRHTATWAWGDGTNSPGKVIEAGGSGSVTGSHIYSSPGVFVLRLTVVDDDAGRTTAQYQSIVVYNPATGP